MKTYRVEIWDDAQNDFVTYSKHKDYDYAIFNAEVQKLSRKHVRVIHEGKIIWRWN